MHRSWFALLLLAAAPLAANASQKLSYDYVEAGYVRADTAWDADGWGITGSKSVTPQMNLFGSYVDLNSDRFQSADIRQWTVGAGFHHPVNDNVHLVARVSWASIDAPQIVEKNGLTAEAGVRAALGQRVETWALAGYGDVDLLNGEFYGRVGAEAKFGDHLGLAGDVKFVGGDTQWFVGPRFSW